MSDKIPVNSKIFLPCMWAGTICNVLNIFMNINQVNSSKMFVAFFMHTLSGSVEYNEFLN